LTRGRILVVEDRENLLRLVETTLVEAGFEVDVAADGESGIELATASSYDLVLTDLKLPAASGLDLLRAVKRAQPATPVVVFTAFGSVGTAVEAMKLGAADFLEKPIEIEDLLRLADTWVRQEGDVPSYELTDGTAIIGRHPRVKAALRLLERVAPSEATVLLLGESGTGKELFARGLHLLSNRRAGPFVAVNCAAIPETLIENELFGHEKGAFTGASRREKGRFELASGGTLLLDEIGELPLAVQGKVLRVLEERTFERASRSMPTCDWSPPPTAISRRWSRAASSAPTSSSASTSSRSSCRRCASAHRTCRRSPATCSSSSPSATADRRRG
jgi:DNA-binding NtrC family response regulator